MAGRDDPTKAPLVKLELKAARKALGVRQRQARAIRYKGDVTDLDGPAAGVCLAHLLKACRRDWLGLRDTALLRVAYDTGCRRSELVAIEVGHIDGPDQEGAGTLLIPTSKTDREGEGALAYLSPATMRAIEAWRDAGRIERGPLFRRIHAYLDGSPRTIGQGALHPGSITLIYKRLIRAAHDEGTARRDERGRARALGCGGVEPLDPGRGRAGQFRRRRGAAGDHAGVSLARSEDGDALRRQARRQERRERAAGEAVF